MTLEEMLKDKANLQRELQGAHIAVTRCEGALIYLDAKIAQAQKEAAAPEPEPPKEDSDGS